MRYLLIFLLSLSCSSENKKTYFNCSVGNITELLTIDIKNKKMKFMGIVYENITINDGQIFTSNNPNERKKLLIFQRFQSELLTGVYVTEKNSRINTTWKCLKADRVI